MTFVSRSGTMLAD